MLNNETSTSVRTMELEKKLILEEYDKMKEFDKIKIESKKFLKSSEISVETRKKGNKLFGQKNHSAKLHEEMWKLYSKSIATAFTGSEELAAGYANRSALLVHLRKYKEAVQDIERALKIVTSDLIKVKLFCRKTECLVALQEGKQKISLAKAKYWLNKIDDEEKSKKMLIEMVEKAEKIVEENVADCKKKEKIPDVQVTNDAVCIDYTKKYGRCLTASRDIRVGEFICMEKFYVTSINSKKFYAYCSHCLALSWTTIPCDNCSYYMYCSEKCKEEAWQKYHDIECSTHNGIDDSADYYTQLSIRALVMGIRETGSIKKLRDMINDIEKSTDEKTKGFTKDGKFLSDSFRSLFSLSFSKSTENRKCFPRNALYALHALAKNTNILGNDFNYDYRNLIKNQDAFFIGTLLLRLHSIFALNAFTAIDPSFDCKKTDNQFLCVSSRCCPRGMSFSPLVSLFNHSCDANASKFYTNDGSVVYYALKPISKGSQIFSSYHYCSFDLVKKSQRQEMMSSLFEFDCNCIACTKNYPFAGDDALTKVMAEHPIGLVQCQLTMMKHDSIMKTTRDKHYRRFNEKMIHDFTKDMEKVLKDSKVPSFVFQALILAMLVMMEGTYGTRLHIPKECRM